MGKPVSHNFPTNVSKWEFSHLQTMAKYNFTHNPRIVSAFYWKQKKGRKKGDLSDSCKDLCQLPFNFPKSKQTYFVLDYKEEKNEKQQR